MSSQTERAPEFDNIPDFMYARRPVDVQRSIDTALQNSAGRKYFPYINNGLYDDYDFGVGIPLSFASQQVKSLEEQKAHKLTILDAGCGAGGFIARMLQEGHDAYGISLHDYRTIEDKIGAPIVREINDNIPSDRYLVGDIQALQEIEDLPKSFDIVLSRLAFLHLIDPLSALEQLADRVKVGGLMLIDDPKYFYPIYKEAKFTSNNTRELVVQGLARAGFAGMSSIGQDQRPGVLTQDRLVVARSGPVYPVRFDIDYADN